jgi:hypothetical protein
MFPRVREWICTAAAFAALMAPMFMAGAEAPSDTPTKMTTYE